MATTRRLAVQDWPTMNHYADAKADVIARILGRTSNPGRTGWPTHIYFWSGTSQGVADDSDPSESVRIALMSVTEIDDFIVDGATVDPALLIGRFVAAAHGLIGAPAPASSPTA